MKINRTHSIDVEIAEKLQNCNASELINRLLKEYFEIRSDKNTLKEEKIAVFDAISKKKSYFPRKLRLLMNGIHLILIISRRHGLKQGINFLRMERYWPTFTTEGSKLFLEHLEEHVSSLKNMERSSNE